MKKFILNNNMKIIAYFLVIILYPVWFIPLLLIALITLIVWKRKDVNRFMAFIMTFTIPWFLVENRPIKELDYPDYSFIKTYWLYIRNEIK